MRYYVDDDEDTDDDEHFFRIIFMFVCSKNRQTKIKQTKYCKKEKNRFDIRQSVFCASYAS